MPRKKKSTTSTKAKATPEQKPVAAAAPAPAPADAAPEDPVPTCSELMAGLVTDMEKLAKITRGLCNSLKKAKRAHDKELKAALKAAKGKKKVKDPNAPKRAPSGFNKPAPLSSELCKFLGVDKKIEMTRPAVTKMITAYIKEHNLQNPANKREIVPDKKLGKLLSGPTDKDEALSFFNLQKYIKHHFPKPKTAAKK
jgi:chromatin remodeling complex protein RSC6